MAGNVGYPGPAGERSAAVALDHVSTAGGEGAATGLRDVTLGVRAGRFLAVVGPPGSGAAALLGCIEGEAPPVSGTVWWQAGGPHGVARVAQAETLPSRLRVGEVVERRPPGVDAAVLRRIYRGAGLRRFRHRRIGSLPPEVRQRVAVARASVGSPSILLATRADGRGDSALAAGLRRAVDSLGLTAVMATDRPAAAAAADSVVFMRRGVIVDMVAGADARLIEACLARIHPVSDRPGE